MVAGLVGLASGATSDGTALHLHRALRSPQRNTRIFTNNPDLNSAAAGAFVGSLLSFAQNQVFNPCPKTNKNTRFGGNFVAGAAAGYGISQLASNFLGGCG